MRRALLQPGFTALLAAALLAPGLVRAAAAADPRNPAVSPWEAVLAAHADAKRLHDRLKLAYPDDEVDLGRYRYFWLPAREPLVLAYEQVAFTLHMNLLSKYARPLPLSYAPDAYLCLVNENLIRVDTDVLKWDRATLEAARFQDPFFHRQKVQEKDAVFQQYWPGGVNSRTGKKFERGKDYVFKAAAGETAPVAAEWVPPKEIDELREMLTTEVPVLNGQWFVAQSARQQSIFNEETGLGYADFLQFKDRNDFFKIVRFNQKDVEDLDRSVRAVQARSGVSPTGRQLVKWGGVSGGGAATGPGWVALDAIKAKDKKLATKQIERGTFRHDIEEWYFHLPNDLPLLGLFDKDGVRQLNAPGDKAGFGDKSRLNRGNDVRIHLGTINCLGCHEGGVLRDISDHVRRTTANPIALGLGVLKSKRDYDRFAQIQLDYFSDLEKALEQDRQTYYDAFRAATVTPHCKQGLTAQRAVEVYADFYHRYVSDEVTLEQAAWDLGVSKTFLRDGLRWAASLPPDEKPKNIGVKFNLAGYLKEKPELVGRTDWEDGYPDAHFFLAKYLIFLKATGKSP